VTPALADILQTSYDNLKSLGQYDLVMTDDRAPVEAIAHKIIFQYIFSGDASRIGGVR
jgi:hypothetical protein